jgi:hypothetical protein
LRIWRRSAPVMGCLANSRKTMPGERRTARMKEIKPQTEAGAEELT